MLLANIAYKQANGLKGREWHKAGGLMYDITTGVAKVKLLGTRLGLFIAKPDPDKWPQLPFIQGTISYPIDVYDDHVVRLYCGYLTNAENKRGEDIFTIVLENLPHTADKAGIWLDLEYGVAPYEEERKTKWSPF